jgi:mannose-1-phosphate guanylyltransferase
MNHVYAIILAGGSGTRFWPASRKRQPKQLLPLSTETERSLIGSTLSRISSICAPSQVYVATGEHLVDETRRHLPELPNDAFLAEPTPRNTAPCIGWATRIIERRDPQAVVFVIPSDQLVTVRSAFEQAVHDALRSASTGVITTIGLTPTRPETGYGYIEIGETLTGDVSRVSRFVEKPNLERAKEYQASGRLDEIDAAAKQGAAVELEATRRIFPTLPSVSIDVGVLEKEPTLNVVRAEFGWNDLGSFASIWENSKTDAQGNSAPDNTVLVDSTNNLVFSQGKQKRLTALLGVSDLCIVETDDAVLVMPRDRAQDVRAIVDALAAQGRKDLL